MNVIKTTNEINILASSVETSRGLVFVPAFNGLFAPYWRPDSRGVMIGLTQFHTKAHICRSALDSIALQINDVLDAMTHDCDFKIQSLKVDGGVTNSEVLLQIQANVSNVVVLKPNYIETTSLGAAIGAKK